MSVVVVSRTLSTELGEEVAYELATDFQHYIANPSLHYGDIFGRDKGFLYPEIVVKNGLRHVHMETPCVESYWQSNWDRQAAQAEYTSDKILVYGRMDVSLYPYLLLTILDPKGHAQMSDMERMKAVGEEYEEEVFAYSTRLPTQQWVTARMKSS